MYYVAVVPVDETARHDQVAHKIGCLYISLQGWGQIRFIKYKY